MEDLIESARQTYEQYTCNSLAIKNKVWEELIHHQPGGRRERTLKWIVVCIIPVVMVVMPFGNPIANAPSPIYHEISLR